MLVFQTEFSPPGRSSDRGVMVKFPLFPYPVHIKNTVPRLPTAFSQCAFPQKPGPGQLSGSCAQHTHIPAHSCPNTIHHLWNHNLKHTHTPQTPKRVNPACGGGGYGAPAAAHVHHSVHEPLDAQRCRGGPRQPRGAVCNAVCPGPGAQVHMTKDIGKVAEN